MKVDTYIIGNKYIIQVVCAIYSEEPRQSEEVGAGRVYLGGADTGKGAANVCHPFTDAKYLPNAQSTKYYSYSEAIDNTLVGKFRSAVVWWGGGGVVVLEEGEF